MKRLSLYQAQSVATLSSTTGIPEVQPLLNRLRDEYGAVNEQVSGWTLTYQPQWLCEDTLIKALGCVKVALAVTSTNQQAKAYNPPFFLFAEHQYAGRGQRGKQWLALPGDAILLSVVVPSPPEIEGLSVAIGACLWKKLSNRQYLRLKWPNDILDIKGRKIGGILIECIGQKTIIGIGLNRSMTATLATRIKQLPDNKATIAGSLGNILSNSDQRHACAVLIARTIVRTVTLFSRYGFSPFRSLAIAAHIVQAGKPLRWQDGRQETFVGFTPQGALLTEHNHQSYHYVNSDVSYMAGD